MSFIRPTSAGSGADFTTTFPATENPISQSGIWTNGGTDGLDWQDVETTPGKAFASGLAGGTFYGGEFDDPIAHLKKSYRTFANNQFARGVVHRTVGYAPTTSHEAELYVRMEITAHNARGYEGLHSHDGFMAIVRWNGPLADPTNSNAGYVELINSGGVVGGPAADGDILELRVVGTVLTFKKNGSTILTYDTASDGTKWSEGQPGMGFWPRFGSPSAEPDKYGWKQYTAGDL